MAVNLDEAAFRFLQEQTVTQGISDGVFGARLCVFVCSVFLIIFYMFQYYQKKCNAHPIYVQSVTALVYCLATFASTDFLFIRLANSQGEVLEVAIGRYLFWIMTCPVIIANINILLNIMTPEDVELSRISFMMVKDIVLMSFGVLGAIQTEPALKWTFIMGSFAIGGALMYDLYHLVKSKMPLFKSLEGNCWNWILVVMSTFSLSWGIFPLLYVLGPPGLKLIGPQGDRIGHAVGDLFAKNLFGFTCWYVRFVVFAPHTKRLRAARAVAPYRRGQISASKLAQLEALSSDKKKRGDINRKHSRIVIIEPRIELQRLFSLMLSEASIQIEFAFDLATASKIVRREKIGFFDGMLINLGVAFNNRGETTQF